MSRSARAGRSICSWRDTGDARGSITGDINPFGYGRQSGLGRLTPGSRSLTSSDNPGFNSVANHTGQRTSGSFTNNSSNNWAATPTLVIAKREVNCPDWQPQLTSIPTAPSLERLSRCHPTKMRPAGSRKSDSRFVQENALHASAGWRPRLSPVSRHWGPGTIVALLGATEP